MVNERTVLCVVEILALLGGSARADLSYYIWNDWGGTWSDAEKTIANTEDDNLCWAAASSNVLAYTGWGKVGGMTTTDDMFAHFQAHWTDDPGNPYEALGWWWNGVNDMQGVPGWAQVDVGGGGGFYPALNIDDYRRWAGVGSDALSTLDAWLHDGYASAISIEGNMAHAITAWGFTYDSGNSAYYTGIYVSDSDDDETNAPTYPDSLRYYGLEHIGSAWYLSGGYFGSRSNYISEISGLEIRAVPIPGALLLGMLGLTVAGAKLRGRKD